MNKNEAADLATRIAQTWPRGVQTSVWEEELLTMDAGRAGTALVRLRRTETHAPSIARFWAEYRTISTADASTRHPDCTRCDNAGFKYITHLDGDGRERVSHVEPCHCPHGDDRAASHASIVASNEAELNRINPTRHQPRTARSNAA